MDYSVFYPAIEKDLELQNEISTLKEQYFASTDKRKDKKLEKELSSLINEKNSLAVDNMRLLHKMIANEKNFPESSLVFETPNKQGIINLIRRKKSFELSGIEFPTGGETYGENENGQILILFEVFDKDFNLLQLLSVMAHETEHAFQNLNSEEYNGIGMPKNAQINDIVKKYSSSKNPAILEALRRLKIIEEHYSPAFYLNSIHEIDARNEAAKTTLALSLGTQKYLNNKLEKEIRKVASGNFEDSKKVEELSRKIDLVMEEPIVNDSIKSEKVAKDLKQAIRDVLKLDNFSFLSEIMLNPTSFDLNDESNHFFTDVACLYDIFLTPEEKSNFTNYLKSLDDKSMYIQAQAQINHISAKQLLDEFEGKANEEELQAMVLYGKGNKHVLSELRKHGTEAERDALNKLPDYLFFTQFKNYYSSNNERVEAINSWVNANVNSKEDMIKCKTSLQQIIEHRLLDEKSSKEVVASYVAKISALSEELGTPYSPSDILSDKNPNDFSQCGCKLANRYIDEFFVKDSVRYSSNQNKRHKKHISKIANQTLQERAM